MLASTTLVFAAAAAMAGPPPASALPAAGPQPRTMKHTPAHKFGLADQQIMRGSRDDAAAMFDLLARNPDGDVRNEARFRHSKLLVTQR
jgi:hypothetical protein